MRIQLTFNEKTFTADLGKPLPIATLLKNGSGVNCYGAPPFKAEPVKVDSFIGRIEDGSPVNFFNIRINPHGNGTHTECVGHIQQGPLFINELITTTHCIARLVSLTPEMEGEDQIIRSNSITSLKEIPEALIVRTLPNAESKQARNYTATNPPYFEPHFFDVIRQKGVMHFLTDLPSLDREEDEGRLLSHKAFWGIPVSQRTEASITELVYVEDTIPDGLYLLNLQLLNIELDVSPSRPVLYHLEPKEHEEI